MELFRKRLGRGGSKYPWWGQMSAKTLTSSQNQLAYRRIHSLNRIRQTFWDKSTSSRHVMNHARPPRAKLEGDLTHSVVNHSNMPGSFSAKREKMVSQTGKRLVKYSAPFS